MRVVQTLPGPTPTLTASAPARQRSSAPSAVATLPATIWTSSPSARSSSSARSACSAWPWAMSSTSASQPAATSAVGALERTRRARRRPRRRAAGRGASLPASGRSARLSRSRSETRPAQAAVPSTTGSFSKRCSTRSCARRAGVDRRPRHRPGARAGVASSRAGCASPRAAIRSRRVSRPRSRPSPSTSSSPRHAALAHERARIAHGRVVAQRPRLVDDEALGALGALDLRDLALDRQEAVDHADARRPAPSRSPSRTRRPSPCWPRSTGEADSIARVRRVRVLTSRARADARAQRDEQDVVVGEGERRVEGHRKDGSPGAGGPGACQRSRAARRTIQPRRAPRGFFQGSRRARAGAAPGSAIGARRLRPASTGAATSTGCRTGSRRFAQPVDRRPERDLRGVRARDGTSTRPRTGRRCARRRARLRARPSHHASMLCANPSRCSSSVGGDDVVVDPAVRPRGRHSRVRPARRPYRGAARTGAGNGAASGWHGSRRAADPARIGRPPREPVVDRHRERALPIGGDQRARLEIGADREQPVGVCRIGRGKPPAVRGRFAWGHVPHDAPAAGSSPAAGGRLGRAS